MVWKTVLRVLCGIQFLSMSMCYHPVPLVSIPTDVPTDATTCHCDCPDIVIYPVVNITKELQAKLDNLKKETKVDEENLSSTIRARTSASDPRPTSAYVGYFGIALLSLIFGGILLLDLPRLIMALKTVCS